MTCLKKKMTVTAMTQLKAKRAINGSRRSGKYIQKLVKIFFHISPTLKLQLPTYLERGIAFVLNIKC